MRVQDRNVAFKAQMNVDARTLHKFGERVARDIIEVSKLVEASPSPAIVNLEYYPQKGIFFEKLQLTQKRLWGLPNKIVGFLTDAIGEISEEGGVKKWLESNLRQLGILE